jgi:pimeloyl-ACP methyl ester carboxylesterase
MFHFYTTGEKMYRARLEGRSARHRLRGVDYHVTEWGNADSPLLVFLHGWGDAGSTFQFVVDELKDDWFVIAPDWRGFGETRLEAESYWFPDYLADLDALLEIYSPDAPVRLMGHSMGANVASLYAGVMPERVAVVVNIEGFGLLDSKPEDGSRPLSAVARGESIAASLFELRLARGAGHQNHSPQPPIK